MRGRDGEIDKKGISFSLEVNSERKNLMNREQKNSSDIDDNLK